MNLRRLLLCALLMLAAPVGLVAGAARPVLTWMVLDLPPGSKPVNGQLTDGISDLMLKMVFEAMPEFEHRILVANAARAMSKLAEGEPVCFGSAAYSTERERVAYFTLAYLIPPLQVVARADVAPRLPRNDRGEVPPAALFDAPDLRGLIVPQRSYSDLLDELLARRAAASGIKTVLASDGGSNILRMLKLDRADYSIEYDFVVDHLIGRTPELRREEYRLLPIAGLQPLPVGIACPHTPWGRQTIQRIDAAVSRIAARPAYKRALMNWLPPESARRYERAIDEFIQQRTRPSDAAKFPPWPSPR